MVKFNAINNYSEQLATGLDGEGTTDGNDILVVHTDQNAATSIAIINRHNTVAETLVEGKISIQCKLNAGDSLTEGGIALGNDLSDRVGGLGADVQNRLCIFSNAFVDGITYRSRKAATDHIWTIDESGDDGTEVMRLETAGISFDAGTTNLGTYTEGTFTPDVGGSTSDPTTGWATAAGHFTQIGNCVFVKVILIGDGSTYTGGSGRLQIELTGLPTIATGDEGTNGILGIAYLNFDLTADTVQLNAITIAASQVLEAQESFDNGGQSAPVVGALANDGRIYVTGQYFV